MNLHKKERKQKQYIRLAQELHKLWEARSQLPSIPLDEPIQQGWKKFHVLRDDAANLDDVEAFRWILKHVGTTIYSKRKDFKERHGKVWKDKHHPVRSIHRDNYDQIPDQCKKHFYLCNLFCPECYVKKAKYHHARYHFNKLFYLDSKIEPHFLTHYRVPDGDIESRIAQINKVMYDEHGWEILGRLKGQSYGWEWGYDDTILGIKDRIAKRELKTELRDR